METSYEFTAHSFTCHLFRAILNKKFFFKFKSEFVFIYEFFLHIKKNIEINQELKYGYYYCMERVRVYRQRK